MGDKPRTVLGAVKSVKTRRKSDELKIKVPKIRLPKAKAPKLRMPRFRFGRFF